MPILAGPGTIATAMNLCFVSWHRSSICHHRFFCYFMCHFLLYLYLWREAGQSYRPKYYGCHNKNDGANFGGHWRADANWRHWSSHKSVQLIAVQFFLFNKIYRKKDKRYQIADFLLSHSFNLCRLSLWWSATDSPTYLTAIRLATLIFILYITEIRRQWHTFLSHLAPQQKTVTENNRKTFFPNLFLIQVMRLSRQ